MRKYKRADGELSERTYCTLGACQPAAPGEKGRSFELMVVAATAEGDWPVGLLVSAEMAILQGFAPSAFNHCHAYRKADGTVVLGSQSSKAHDAAGDTRVGRVAGHLFAPRSGPPIEVPGASFELFAITLLMDEDVDLIAKDNGSPASVLLLMQRLGLGRSSMLDRPALLEFGGAREIWKDIRALDHDRIMSELEISTGDPLPG